jgi:hypothetical protein
MGRKAMDLTALEKMNHEMPLRENAGDRQYFEARLASSIGMLRADRTVIGRDEYLNALKKDGDRASVSIESITMLGKTRALVVCTVRSRGKLFENARLFIRDEAAPEGWLLLGWANEPAVLEDR